MSDFLPFIVIGITAGSVYGLAGVGLVLTYRTSGVFNFAHGAIATAGSYLFFELWNELGWPWPVAALSVVVGFGVVLGYLLEHLARRLSHVPAAVTVVATVGLLLAITSAASVRYGSATQTVPTFLPSSSFRFAGVNVGWDQLIIVLVGVIVSAGPVGGPRPDPIRHGRPRAVVDDPTSRAHGLRRQRGSAGRPGCSAARSPSLSGILIAPTIGLNPLLLTFLVVQAFGAAAIGRFQSLPLTFVGGLAIGVAASFGQKYATNFPVLLGLPASVPFIVLFVVLVTARPGSLPTGVSVRRPRLDRLTPMPHAARLSLALWALAIVVILPSVVDTKLPLYTSGAGFVIVFLSLNLLVKVAGQVSLCHAAFVAVGAVAFSRLTVDVGLPWPVALLGAGLVTVPVGFVVALPAIRLSGVYLALATFAFGLLMENLVYRTFLLFGSEGSRVAPRPDLPGVEIGSDRGYFYVAVSLAVVAALVLVVLQRSRLGRLLSALADSPLALTTFGTGVNTTLVLLFCISAFFAGVSGAVLAAGNGTAGPAGIGSFQSLLWIAVIAISGNRLVSSSVVAAVLLAIIPGYLPLEWQEYQPIAFGTAAIITALVAANNFDWVARVKQDLTESIRARSRPPLTARSPGSRVAGSRPLGSAPGPDRVGGGVMTVDATQVQMVDGLAIDDLVVRFGGVTAVDHFSLRAPLGSITGLIGPNGAGKSTTFNSVLRPQSADERHRHVRRRGPHLGARLPPGPRRHRPHLPADRAVRQPVGL